MLKHKIFLFPDNVETQKGAYLGKIKNTDKSLFFLLAPGLGLESIQGGRCYMLVLIPLPKGAYLRHISQKMGNTVTLKFEKLVIQVNFGNCCQFHSNGKLGPWCSTSKKLHRYQVF